MYFAKQIVTYMYIHSVNIGLPQKVEWRGDIVTTGIFKYATDSAVKVREFNMEGDGQADLKNHGGENKAIYAYAAEHYQYWNSLRQEEIEPGSFGENLTTQGLLDSEVCIGDQFLIGTAVLMAVQPRIPCFKLGIRFNDIKVVRQFFEARRNGIYFKIIKEGVLQKGDAISLWKRSDYDITVQDVVDNYTLKEKDLEKVRSIIEIPFLPKRMKLEFIDILSSEF